MERTGFLLEIVSGLTRSVRTFLILHRGPAVLRQTLPRPFYCTFYTNFWAERVHDMTK